MASGATIKSMHSLLVADVHTNPSGGEVLRVSYRQYRVLRFAKRLSARSATRIRWTNIFLLRIRAPHKRTHE